MVSIAIYPTKILLTDYREHPLSNKEEYILEQFMNGLGTQDIIVSGGLGTISLLSDVTTFYRSFAEDNHKNGYFIGHHGKVPVVYTLVYPPLWNGKQLNNESMLEKYKEAGVFNNTTYIWMLDSGWSHIWDGFIDCMVKSGNAVVRPELDKASLGDYGYLVHPKFIGIRTEVLLKHAYTCQ